MQDKLNSTPGEQLKNSSVDLKFNKERLPYVPPTIEMERLFEITGLGCGKCVGGEPGGDLGDPCQFSDGAS